MVSPVQFNNCRRVYFRGEKEDLINAPGKFEQQAVPETPADDVTLSTQEVEEKSSTGKTIAKVVGTIVVAAAALFGAYKWKGDTWLNKEAKGFWPKLKNWLMKPGEYMEKGYNKLRGKNNVNNKNGTNPTPEGGANPTPEGGANPTPEGGANPTPKGGANPTPEGGANPTPKGGANPTPEGGANPTPKGEGSAQS